MSDGYQADDRGAVRRTIAILSVCGFASALSTRFVDPMIGVIARDLRADPLTVALLSTAYALPYALIQPVLGPVGDALGKERVMKVLLALLAVMLAGASLTDSLPALFVLRILSGIAAGGIIPMSLATIGDRVAMGERQVAIGRFLTATITGQLLGGVGSGLLAEWVGWRGVFALAGGLAALGTVAAFTGFRNASAAGGELSFKVAGARYRHILGIPRARALIALVFCEGVLVFGIQPYIAPLLERAGLGGASEAGLMIGAFALGGIVYTLLVRWILRTLGLSRMLKASGIIMALGLAVLAPALPWTVGAGAMAAIGLAFYMMHNSFQTQMTEVVSESRASAVSLHAFGFFAGQALGPVMFGLILAAEGRAGAMLTCAAGVLALGFVAAATIGDRRASTD